MRNKSKIMGLNYVLIFSLCMVLCSTYATAQEKKTEVKSEKNSIENIGVLPEKNKDEGATPEGQSTNDAASSSTNTDPIKMPSTEDNLGKEMELRVGEMKTEIFSDSSKLHLVTNGGQGYIDLAREIDRAEREAKRHVGLLKKEEMVRQMVSELKKNIEEIEVLRKKLDEEIGDKSDSNENIQLLVNLYESINAAQAAELLKRLPSMVAIKIFKTMSPRKSSKILAAMEPKLAAELSKRIIRTASSKEKGQSL